MLSLINFIDVHPNSLICDTFVLVPFTQTVKVPKYNSKLSLNKSVMLDSIRLKRPFCYRSYCNENSLMKIVFGKLLSLSLTFAASDERQSIFQPRLWNSRKLIIDPTKATKQTNKIFTKTYFL
jgi:hypothetical protein